MSDTLLIRADGNGQMGTGHVMRCLSLAQGWRHAGGVAHFALASATPALEQRLRSEGLDFTRLNATPGSTDDATQTVACARTLGATWTVVDGYHFGTEFQRALKAAGLRLLMLDDYGHAEHYFADLILNQNLGATEEPYRSREPYTRLLLGPQYVLLREQFLAYREWQREVPAVARKILVTFGGADPDNVTGKVINALHGLDVEAKLVIGGSNPHFDSLSSVISPPSTVLRDVSNMPELMAWADIAIAAGGTTLWEMAFMGLPSLVILLADNQRGYAELVRQTGLGICLGWHAEVTPAQITKAIKSFANDFSDRRRLARDLRQFIDGQGTSRVVHAIRENSATIPDTAREVQPVPR